MAPRSHGDTDRSKKDAFGRCQARVTGLLHVRAASSGGDIQEIFRLRKKKMRKGPRAIASPRRRENASGLL
jgi:hypothetical protein